MLRLTCAEFRRTEQLWLACPSAVDGRFAATVCGRAGKLVSEVNKRRDGNDAALVTKVEEFADGLASVGAVVESALVDVHADKAAGRSGVEFAGKLHGVFESLLAVIECVLDAVAQGLGDDLVLFSSERAADGVAAEGQHQAGGFLPPDAKIENLVEAADVVGELSFVNNESGVIGSGKNSGNDLVEGNGLRLNGGIEDWRRSWGRTPRRRFRRNPSGCSCSERKDRHES